MKNLIGLEIEEVDDLGNGDLSIGLDDGTTLIGHIYIVSGEAPTKKEAEKPAPASKAPEPKGPKVPTWDELVDMDLDELKDVIDDHDLEIKTKGKDEDDLREEIAKALDLEAPAETADDDDDDDDAPAKPGKGDDDALTFKDLEEMDFDELCDLVKEEELGIKTKNYDEDDDEEVTELREAIAAKMAIKVPSKKKK
jgi:hypothetical protein